MYNVTLKSDSNVNLHGNLACFTI